MGEPFVDVSAEDWAASTACRCSGFRTCDGPVDPAATFDLRDSEDRRLRGFTSTAVVEDGGGVRAGRESGKDADRFVKVGSSTEVGGDDDGWSVEARER